MITEFSFNGREITIKDGNLYKRDTDFYNNNMADFGGKTYEIERTHLNYRYVQIVVYGYMHYYIRLRDIERKDVWDISLACLYAELKTR